MGRLIAIASIAVGHPSEATTIGHLDRERLTRARHARQKPGRLQDHLRDLPGKCLLRCIVEIAPEEDEPVIALQLESQLNAAGARVYSAGRLRDALYMAEHPALSAAVLDFRLGGDNSVAVLDTSDKHMMKTIPIPSGRHGPIMTPDGSACMQAAMVTRESPSSAQRGSFVPCIRRAPGGVFRVGIPHDA